jgi:hypothetical protein
MSEPPEGEVDCSVKVVSCQNMAAYQFYHPPPPSRALDNYTYLSEGLGSIPRGGGGGGGQPGAKVAFTELTLYLETETEETDRQIGSRTAKAELDRNRQIHRREENKTVNDI